MAAWVRRMFTFRGTTDKSRSERLLYALMPYRVASGKLDFRWKFNLDLRPQGSCARSYCFRCIRVRSVPIHSEMLVGEMQGVRQIERIYPIDDY